LFADPNQQFSTFPGSISVVFKFTEEEQTFTVPAGVYEVMLSVGVRKDLILTELGVEGWVGTHKPTSR